MKWRCPDRTQKEQGDNWGASVAPPGPATRLSSVPFRNSSRKAIYCEIKIISSSSHVRDRFLKCVSNRFLLFQHPWPVRLLITAAVNKPSSVPKTKCLRPFQRVIFSKSSPYSGVKHFIEAYRCCYLVIVLYICKYRSCVELVRKRTCYVLAGFNVVAFEFLLSGADSGQGFGLSPRQRNGEWNFWRRF